MSSLRRACWLALLLVGIEMMPAEAKDRALALEPEIGSRTTLEFSLGAGVLGQNTMGVGGALLGHGYDRQAGLAIDLGARWLIEQNRGFEHGLLLRGAVQSGPALAGEYGFRFGIVDMAYTARLHCSCMSRGNRRVYLSGRVGLSGSIADAGIGRGAFGGGDENARRYASRSLDHLSLGYVLGASLDVYLGSLFVGLGLDFRQHFGFTTVADRHILPSAMLRFGGAIGGR
ncbi:MAG: hypothetical protein OEY14_05810 [Myxococcales bacterium]|nr:hypothetical protein [Myxococcales bacterium]